MNNSDLKNLLNESRRKQDPLQVALLSFLLGEFELQNSKNSNVTVDQIVHKAIENNQTCLEARHDEKLVAENQFFSDYSPELIQRLLGFWPKVCNPRLFLLYFNKPFTSIFVAAFLSRSSSISHLLH